MAFRWRADAGPILNAGLVAFSIFHGIRTSIAIAKKPYIFVIFQGGWALTPCPLSGSAHVFQASTQSVDHHLNGVSYRLAKSSTIGEYIENLLSINSFICYHFIGYAYGVLGR